MRAISILVCLLICACATVPTRGPAGQNARTATQEPQSYLLLDDIYFRIPDRRWTVAAEPPRGAKVLLIERQTNATIIVRVIPGRVKRALSIFRGDLTGAHDDKNSSLTPVMKDDGGQIAYFRVYRLDENRKPISCMFYAIRQLTDSPDRTAVITGTWSNADDSRFAPLALDLLRSITHAPDR